MYRKKTAGKITIAGKTLDIRSLDYEKLNKKVAAELSDEIEKISICSSFGNIKVRSAKEAEKVEARLFSEGTLAGNAKLDIEQLTKELLITSSFAGICNGGPLQLEVIVPEKSFNKIAINPA